MDDRPVFPDQKLIFRCQGCGRAKPDDSTRARPVMTCVCGCGEWGATVLLAETPEGLVVTGDVPPEWPS